MVLRLRPLAVGRAAPGSQDRGSVRRLALRLSRSAMGSKCDTLDLIGQPRSGELDPGGSGGNGWQTRPPLSFIR